MARDRDHDARSLLGGAEEDENAPSIDEQVQQQLGRILSRYTDDLLNQPVPDSFLALLAKLEAREREDG